MGASGAMDAAAPAKVLITQVYGGGGNSSATYQNDFVELFNAGGTSQDLSTWSIQYASSTGTGNLGASSSQLIVLTGSIAPGQYYLAKLKSTAAVGALLPGADATNATLDMAAGAGKVALVDQTASVGCNGGSAPCTTAQRAHIIDLVGYGSANFFEGAPTGTLSSTKSARRLDRCTDTDNNAADFEVVTPTPRYSATPLAPCTVVAPVLGSVTVANATVNSGSNVTLTADLKNTNGQPYTGAVTLTWTSADPTVAEFVSQSGNTAVFTGHGAGGSTSIAVTATAGTTTVTASPSPTITVVGPLDHVVVTGPTTVSAGSAITLTATLKDAADQTIVDPAATYTWTSSDPATAKVDAQSANTVSIKGVIAGGPITINLSATSSGVTKSPATAPTVTVTGVPVIVPSTTVVSEIHYDNAGTDAGEAIEIEGNAGASLEGWKLVFYDGTTSAEYLTTPLSGLIPSNCDNGRGVLVIPFPVNGIQNGSLDGTVPDGWALVNAQNQVTEFRSYEGVITALSGVATGLVSSRIDADETTPPSAGFSVQRAGNGVWFGPKQNTFGACNRPTPPPIEKLALRDGKELLALGMQTQWFYTDNSGTGVSSVVWSSSDPTVFSVDSRGIVSAKKLGTATLTVTSANDASIFGSVDVTIYIASGSSGVRLGHNEEFGEPRDGNDADDFLIHRSQYTVSYNRFRGGANWVSWNLDATHLGGSGRCTGTCYSADTALVNAGITAYTTADWVSNSTWDRGHMAPSADWTSSEADNNTTFFLSNFLPQAPDLNQGPWERLENALRDSVSAGREAYIIAGGIFTNGTGQGSIFNLGKIWIPDSTWKIAVIVPAGQGIGPGGTLPANTTVLAVNMPNVQGIRAVDWQTYVTTIAKIQQSTGYDFLDLLSEPTECLVEVRNCAPTARITAGSYSASEGQSLSFSGASSSDPNAGDVLAKQWYVNGVSAGSGDAFTYTFPNDGTYEVKLIVTDNAGSNSTAIATVAISNVAPVVGAFSGATVVRGQTYSATGSFTDPGADSWSGTVNYGDGYSAPLAITGHSFSLAHTYASLGSYTVTVSVNDGDATDSRTATVQVIDVAPVIGAFAGASILRGETYAAAGSFTDPDLDSWTGTVNYGDGTSGSLSISGHSFDLSHAYTTAGTYTVVVTVNDGTMSDTRTATVVVKTAAQGIADLQAMAAGLGLNQGQTNSLQSKLANATKQIADGKPTPATNMIEAFMEEISAIEQSGRISAATAAQLTSYAQRVIASM